MTAAGERETDAHWMRLALAAACEARERDEVPIGTCIVVGEAVLAVAGNRTRTDADPTAHAEIVALRAAAKKIVNYRLTDGSLFHGRTLRDVRGRFDSGACEKTGIRRARRTSRRS